MATDVFWKVIELKIEDKIRHLTNKFFLSSDGKRHSFGKGLI